MIRRAAAGLFAAAAAWCALVAPARADEDFHGAQVVYAKGTSLWKTDARGKAKPIELVALPVGASAESVRAIRSDASGHTLLVDLGGTWYWSHVDGDGATALARIGCAPGGAALATDGSCVVCASDKGNASIRKLGTDQHLDRDVPAAGATVTGAGATRALIWADGAGVWSAPVASASSSGAAGASSRKALASDPPLAHFSPAPDGSRALGVYKAADEKGAALLYSFALDGAGARRKVIRNGIPIEWSWDSRWVLVQDGSSACVMRAIGGEYKCWKGYTAVGIAEDGAYALVLGPRDAKAGAEPREKSKSKSKGKSSSKDKRKGKDKGKAKPADDGEGGGDGGAGDGGGDGGAGDGGDDVGDLEPGEADGDTAPTADEAPVPLPRRPFALYRVRRDGAYTDRPVVIVRDVDGPAAWLPAPAATAP